jgi:bifunctional enzyme CysN/CysC
MDLLRFTTAGSVDDGKSTLIGRLLYDSKSIFEDQLEAVRLSSEIKGNGRLNLALLTDGLRAEREQGITIDVAYRYFATPKRKFIIADTPGHVQYTRNMVTGASTAELAIVLVDARKGVLTQSRRHGFIASLLRIPHMVVAVNKMDLVGYSEEVYNNIVADYQDFAQKLDITDITFIPISALNGDNVVDKSAGMTWYQGPTLLHFLETVRVGAEHNVVDFRFPVQYVVRPNQSFRGFAGQVASGSITPGEEVLVLPSNFTTRIKSIVAFEKELPEAKTEESVILTLEDEIDASRGGMIVRSRNRPTVTTTIDADICWMNEQPLRPDKFYLLQHTTRQVSAYVSKIIYRIDVDTLHRSSADTFELNDIGRVEITTAQPVFVDPYRINRRTGSFILIDPDSNNTVGAGMIRGVSQDVAPVGKVSRGREGKSPNVVWEGLNIPREERERRNGHKAAVLWFTGLSGSGKSTIARALERQLFERGVQTMLLDGDYVRHGLCSDLGFSASDRAENIRRVGEVARLFYEQGAITICTFISPYRGDRDLVRSLISDNGFFEVYVDCSIDVCKDRDPKGLYQKAISGEISNFTGISAPYEPPKTPELTLHSDQHTVAESIQQLIQVLEDRGVLGKE